MSKQRYALEVTRWQGKLYTSIERDGRALATSDAVQILNTQAARIAALEAEAAEWRQRVERAERERDAVQSFLLDCAKMNCDENDSGFGIPCRACKAEALFAAIWQNGQSGGEGT